MKALLVHNYQHICWEIKQNGDESTHVELGQHIHILLVKKGHIHTLGSELYDMRVSQK